MDKDRVEGAANTIKGKVQNTVGGIKDKINEESKKP